MGTIPRYNQEFREAVVKKLLSRGSKTIEEFCDENNLAYSTVTKWQRQCANVSDVRTKKRSKYSAEKVLQIVSETYSLNEEEFGVYLRKNGLHSSQITDWKKNIVSSISQPKVQVSRKDERDLKIIELEKNLKRKDAALAEASALLILQKKIQLIWPLKKQDEES